MTEETALALIASQDALAAALSQSVSLVVGSVSVVAFAAGLIAVLFVGGQK